MRAFAGKDERERWEIVKHQVHRLESLGIKGQRIRCGQHRRPRHRLR
jgi:hypothetical protein